MNTKIHGYARPEYSRHRYVSDQFVDKIQGYGDGRYDVRHNLYTGFDVIMRCHPVKYADDKGVAHWRPQWMPVMAVIHPATGKPWGEAPAKYWLRELHRTDMSNWDRDLKHTMQDIERSNRDMVERESTYDQDYALRQSADAIRSFDRTTVTIDKKLGDGDDTNSE